MDETSVASRATCRVDQVQVQDVSLVRVVSHVECYPVVGADFLRPLVLLSRVVSLLRVFDEVARWCEVVLRDQLGVRLGVGGVLHIVSFELANDGLVVVGRVSTMP